MEHTLTYNLTCTVTGREE